VGAGTAAAGLGAGPVEPPGEALPVPAGISAEPDPATTPGAALVRHEPPGPTDAAFDPIRAFGDEPTAIGRGASSSRLGNVVF
jgi:hypothetical protein